MYVISKTIPLISWFPINPITNYDPNINTDPATTKPNTAVRRRLCSYNSIMNTDMAKYHAGLPAMQ